MKVRKVPLSLIGPAIALGLGISLGPWPLSSQTMPDPSVDGPASVDQSLFNHLSWRLVGPFRGGRAPAVAGDPENPLIFYFGTGHGGVWKTTDAGLTWRNVSDGFLNVGPVGALAVAPSDPQTLYVGTGEGIPRQHIAGGDGVYKSTNGGETWVNVGLQATRHIADLVIHPENPDIVYVAAKGNMFGPSTDRGVYRTTDGGQSWEQVLYKNDLAGAVDLSMDPSDPDVLFAALNYHVRYPWDEVSGGPGTGLYKTTDGGDTWIDLTRNPGMPEGDIGKIGVAISPPQPNRVYAFIEAPEGGVYRSDDQGSSWRRVSHDRTMRLFPASYQHIVADTEDQDVVYVLHMAFWKSTDGGETFTTRPMKHSDHHALWIDPNDSRRMIDGSDGGGSVTLNGGASWSELDNQPTADLFSLAIDDQEPYWLYFTQNDNSHIAMPSRTPDRTIDWQHYLDIPQGEGGQTAVKPDGSVVYACDRTSMVRFDRWTEQGQDISVWPEDEFGEAIEDVKYRFYYSFPVLLSPHNPDVLYTAAQYLFRSTDEGNSWDQVSPDLTKNRRDVMGKIPGGPITSLASSLYYVSLIRTIEESPVTEGELWVGTDDSVVQLSRNGGESWEDVSPPELPEWTTITAIDASHHNPGTAYLAGERHRMGDRAPYLYKTTDYGRNWQRITNGIGEHDFAYVIREDPVRPGLLFAGTERGAHVSFDDGASWQSLSGNLPVVSVNYMQVKDNDLVVATHGRGLWILDNITALRGITPQVVSAQAHLFEVAPAIRNLAWNMGPARPTPEAGENPPGGVMIEYYLGDIPAGEVTLTILDSRGLEIRRFSSQAQGGRGIPIQPGTNRFIWDMSYPDPPEAPRDANLTGFEATSPAAPIAPPGQYLARLAAGGRTYERTFQIRKDPRVPATNADLRAQFDLMMDIYDRASDVVDGLNRLHDARRQIEEHEGGMSSQQRERAQEIKETLRAIEGELQRLTGSHAMELGPKGLYNRLGRLTRAVLSADAKPTEAQYAVFQELSSRIDLQLARLDQVIENELRVITGGVDDRRGEK